MIAAGRGYADAIKVLLSAGADVNWKDNNCHPDVTQLVL
jgi:hypothetical protein